MCMEVIVDFISITLLVITFCATIIATCITTAITTASLLLLIRQFCQAHSTFLINTWTFT